MLGAVYNRPDTVVIVRIDLSDYNDRPTAERLDRPAAEVSVVGCGAFTVHAADAPGSAGRSDP